MLVVLGSRLAISCVLNHQSSSGSLTAFHLFPFEALGWCFVFRGQRNTKVQGRLSVELCENIFLLALDFKETISYLDRRLMNQVFLRELLQIVSINWRGHTVL
jgi:hypothetical protein